MEQKAHDVFARLAEREEPSLGFTADEVVTRGRRRARTRRVGTVVGGAVGTLVVTAAVLPLVSLGSGKLPAGPEATVTAPTTPAPDPGCVADLAKSAAPGARFEGAEKTAGLQACPVLKRVNAVLDPEGTHLWASDPTFRHSAPVDVINGFSAADDMNKVNGVESQISWTPDGHYPFKNDGMPDMTGPYAEVRTSIRAGGGPDPYADAPDHRDYGLQGDGKAASGLPWGPATVSTLPDGSTVSLKKEQDSARRGRRGDAHPALRRAADPLCQRSVPGRQHEHARVHRPATHRRGERVRRRGRAAPLPLRLSTGGRPVERSQHNEPTSHTEHTKHTKRRFFVTVSAPDSARIRRHSTLSDS